MTRRRRRRHGEDRLLAELAGALVPRRRPFPLTVVWRWRYELALTAAIAGAVTALLHILGTEWGVITASALAAAFGPPWPAPAADLAWLVITPHRLRTGFSQARLRTAGGRLPVIMRTTRAPFGERVRVWCPAGISAEDLRSARPLLRAACWAADVRVTRDGQHAHIVTVDVIRRPHEYGTARGTGEDASDQEPPPGGAARRAA
jgi:hypothetical protein